MDVVVKNHAAIDAGKDAFVKVNVPADWANAQDEAVEEVAADNKLLKMVNNVMIPVGKMDGDSLPVSAFVDHADGSYSLGASAYEKRGVAVMVPEWNNETCVNCNKCSFVCPHATIRPFAMTEEEVAAAPEGMKIRDIRNKPYKYTLAVSPMDCMGCGVCVGVCPTKSLKMVPRESQDIQQPVFDYCVANVTEKADMVGDNVIASQYRKPLLEFSGSCAGCAETSYARLVPQLFGDRMYISNATGCASIWGGPAATSPYTVNADGHGPAWANSLFEDNAEHGFGMHIAQKKIRDDLIVKVEEIAASENAPESTKAAAQAYLDTVNDGKKNSAAT